MSSSSTLSPVHTAELTAVQLQGIYRWIDSIPLSKPKKNISRDFSDGTLVSEVLHHFLPRLVELHNFSASNAIAQKQYNWKTLNHKLFRKLGFTISNEEIESICLCKKGAIERLLYTVQINLGEYLEKKKKSGNEENSSPNHSLPATPMVGGSKSAVPAPSPSVSKHSNPLTFPSVNPQGTHEKDVLIADLRETVDILTLKVQKLEQLVKLKNTKIVSLQEEVENLKRGK
jgi:hypothetical protein